MTGQAEQITAPVAYHAEGPVWVDQLHWVDMLAGDVLSLGANGTVGRRHVGSVVAAVRPRTAGGFVYAVERGFALDDGVGTPVRTLPELWTTDAVRMNEGGCDPDGRFYCGSMAYAMTPGAASLYRLDPDGSVTTVLGRLTISNGLEWSPDGRLAYYVDSATGRIDVMDYDSDRGLTQRRPFVTVEAGSPDGLTVDAEGGIWVAIWGGSAVHRFTPEGTLSDVIELPATQVTACTFGGDNLDQLFITTSREGLPAGEEPAAGALFHVRPGITGLPVRQFGG
jgi:sugar lactone lactonase YvrE